MSIAGSLDEMPDPRAAARARWLLPAYVLGAPLAGAALAFPVWGLLRAAGIDAGFESLTLRLMELCALALLFPLLRLTGGSDRAAWGYARAPDGRAWREAGHGLLAGVLMLGVPVVLLMGLGVRDLRETTITLVAVALLKASVTATAVALLEETWFRGGLMTAVARGYGALVAIVFTATVYAFVHFLEPVPIPTSAVTPLSGFAVAADAFGNLDVNDVGALATLLFAGLLAGVSRRHTGRIAFAIGMHAGWVLVIQFVRRITRVDRLDADAHLVGTYDGVIGTLVALVFLAAFMATAYAIARTRSPT